jgi:3-hydroxyacyl-[acyl-carrier-protein] dehydratase
MQTLAFSAPTLRKAATYTPPFLFVDRIESYWPSRQRLVGVKLLSRSEPLLQGHFHEFPIFPGVLVIESLAQACRLLITLDQLIEEGTPLHALADTLARGEAPRGFLVESGVKHSGSVFPGSQLHLDVQITAREGDQYSFRVAALVSGVEVSRGRIVLSLVDPAG